MGFSLSSLRGSIQPELSRKLYKLIKTSNNVVGAHESAGRERVSIATQLSDWGEQTGDEAISDVSDKVGVILSEIGEQEDNYAHALDDARGVMKQIRNTEKSVQPSRDGKRKIADEIAKIKSKEPESARLVVLEQELVRAEAENLVAEAQLTNIVSDRNPTVPAFVFDMLLAIVAPPPGGVRKLIREMLCCDRPARSSKNPTTPNSSPRSSGQRSRSSWPATAVVSSSFWTVPPSCQVTSASPTPTALRRARSSTTPKTTSATGSPSPRTSIWDLTSTKLPTTTSSPSSSAAQLPSRAVGS